jgi:hypothetical protein
MLTEGARWLFFRLLEASPKIARAFRDFMFGIAAWASVFVDEANLGAFQKWLWGAPQEQQQVLRQQTVLNKEVEALFVVFQQHMDTQYQVNILASYVLTLTALPEEVSSSSLGHYGDGLLYTSTD